MDYQLLRDEIDNDPIAIGYSAYLPSAPGSVVDLLNAYTQTKIKPITSSTAMAWAAAGPYSNIVDASNDLAHLARASCLVIREVFASGQVIHMELPDITGMFAAWVAAGVITQTQHDELITIATQPASRAEVLGLDRLTEADLRTALELP